MATIKYGKAHLSTIAVRKAAKHSSELVTQLLFNECYTILKQKKDWSYIAIKHDSYEGWIPSNQVQLISDQDFEAVPVRYSAPAIYWEFSLSRHLFMGTPIPAPGDNYHKDKTLDLSLRIIALMRLSKEFLNTPYLWGGRTVAGIDCSGLMQILFRMVDVALPRDAHQQAKVGKAIEWGDHQKGDVAFFANADGKVTHVGLIVSTNMILHASAWVREDLLTEEGIFHEKERTHQLHSLRRFL